MKRDLRVINFPDRNFKRYLVKNFDKDGDGEISLTEALDITVLSCKGLNIESLGGIEFLTNLTHLQCSLNNINNLDLRGNLLLEYLICGNNHLIYLNIENNTLLKTLSCLYNPLLEELDVSNNINLEELRVRNCGLKELDLSKNVNLAKLNCEENDLKSLDLTNNPALTKIITYSNPNLTRIMLNSSYMKEISIRNTINQKFTPFSF